jgi:hypothetical protein
MAPMNRPESLEKAEILALQGLGWLAGEEDGIQRFMEHSGIDAAQLRDSAGSPGMGVAVLDFLLGHEELLLRFCESQEIDPRAVHLARHKLGGEA